MTTLAGVPFVVKDSIDVRGMPTGCGVPGDSPVATRDAEIVRRLRLAGARPLAKAPMDQLGWSVAGRSPGRTPCRNPVDPARSPGGSSSGSAVAVAAGDVPLALGADTAGSVRLPAAFCGIVGFKPALRSLPRRGCRTVVPSLETPGVIARTVGECHAAYEAMVARPAADRADAAPLGVGVLEDLFDGCDTEVAAAVRRALSALSGAHRVEPARLDYRPRGLGRLFAAELNATWGDAIRAEPDRFFDDVRAGAEAGRAVSGAERGAILAALVADRRDVGARLARFDVLASPTVPIVVPRAGEEAVDVCTRLTRPFNALGWPAITVPCGTDRNGCPIGLQLASRPGRVSALFAAALAVEATR